MSKSMSVLSTLLLFALANATFGQSSTATLQGLVTDPTGAAIPGAEVSITDLATNITRRFTTADAGLYSFPLLRPGTYRLEVSKTGFKAAARNRVLLQVSDRVSLDIRAGEVIGVVGKSGSGKSTLAKMLQSLHVPQEGVIRVDGVDLREIDLPWLRRNVGVVLQDNFMFRGTVRENIAIARPNASLEEVVLAARAAGADEFIERLQQGYDTLLEENASNLSGGQRQRLAIARALLLKPRVLIFD